MSQGTPGACSGRYLIGKGTQPLFCHNSQDNVTCATLSLGHTENFFIMSLLPIPMIFFVEDIPILSVRFIS